MGEGWAFTGGPPSPSGTGDVTLVEGRSFCVSDRAGDMESSATHGLIVNDTRFVHHLVLRVDGDRLESLGVQAIGPHAATFVTRRKPHAGLADSTLLVVRNRYVGNGIVEDVTVENLSREAVELTLSLRVGADFADLFEVKEGRAAGAQGVTGSAADGVVTLRSHRDGARAARVTGTGPVAASGSELTWHLAVPARDRATVTVRVEPSVAGTPLRAPTPSARRTSTAAPRSSTRSGGGSAPGSVPASRGSSSSSRPAPTTSPVCASPMRPIPTG